MTFRLRLPIVLLAVLLSAGFARSARAADSREVVVYMYSEYIDPGLVTKFENQTGLKVKISVYESSEEMLAKVSQAGGDKQYDVIVASDVIIPALIKLGLVRELDMAKIPNAKNVAEDFKNPPFDPGSKHSMPYQWGTVGLMYDKTKVGSAPVSWNLLFDPAKTPGTFVLMDSMRDQIGIALKYRGHSMNSTTPADLKAAGDLLIAAKKSAKCAGFEGGVGGKNKVVAGEAAMAVVYNGDAIKAIVEQKKENNLAFAVPVEGSTIWTDVMLITKRGPNNQGAHAFINFILDAGNGAQLSNFNRYASPNAAALPMIDEADRKNPAMYPTAEMMKKLEYLSDVGMKTKLFDEIWTAVKSR